MNNGLEIKTSETSKRRYGVLVADDEPEILDVLHFGLGREGFDVWIAGDGQEALNTFRHHWNDIDVVLLDVRMPRMDGPSAYSEMLKIKPEVPCCFMSGHLGFYTSGGLMTRGARAVLKKPFRLSEAAALLRSVLPSEAPVRVFAEHNGRS